jgi:hypothetical protein
MIYRDLIPDERAVASQIAMAAARAARRSQTVTNGTSSYRNADGTRTVIGSGAGNDETGGAVGVAQWVGDVTAPGRPTGVSASSSGGVTVVSWDGTLEGGVPSDFDHISLLTHYKGSDHKVGELASAGSVSVTGLDEGMQYAFFATAEDAARAQDGSPAHNVSDPSEMVAVTASQAPISGVDVEYALGDSPDAAPVTGWATDSPAWTAGRYVWQRTATTTVSGTSYSEPTCIQGATGAKGDTGSPGAAGKDGDDGLGVSAVVEQYYLSTSSTAQAGGSWGTAQPAWQSGRHIWTRSQVTWSDGTVTTTAPVLARAVNGANELANQASVTAAGAASTAGQALDAANATSQFFWADGSGNHITDEPGNPIAPHNTLVNALGILLRAAENNMLTLTSSGITLYDGQGNAASNVVATFTASGVELGRNSQTASIDMCKGNLSVTSRRTGVSDYGIVHGKNVTILASGEGTSGAVLSVGGTPDETSDMVLGILLDSGDGKGPTVVSQSQVVDVRGVTVKLSDVSPNGKAVTAPMSRAVKLLSDTGWVSLHEASAEFVRYRACAGVCHLQWDLTYGSDGGEWSTTSQIPSGYLPAQSTYLVGEALSSGLAAYAWVSTAGSATYGGRVYFERRSGRTVGTGSWTY